MKKEDIFTDTENLPPELLDQIYFSEETIVNRNIRDLFKIKNPLFVQEVMLGYYRQYGEIKKRNYILGKLYRLSKKGYLEATGKKGQYKIKEPHNDE